MLVFVQFDDCRLLHIIWMDLIGMLKNSSGDLLLLLMCHMRYIDICQRLLIELHRLSFNLIEHFLNFNLIRDFWIEKLRLLTFFTFHKFCCDRKINSDKYGLFSVAWYTYDNKLRKYCIFNCTFCWEMRSREFNNIFRMKVGIIHNPWIQFSKRFTRFTLASGKKVRQIEFLNHTVILRQVTRAKNENLSLSLPPTLNWISLL